MILGIQLIVLLAVFICIEKTKVKLMMKKK